MDSFLKFDWNSCSAWNQYKQNIFIPPDKPQTEIAQIVQKIQVKWYKNNIDPNFVWEPERTEPEPERAPNVSPTRNTTNTSTSPQNDQHNASRFPSMAPSFGLFYSPSFSLNVMVLVYSISYILYGSLNYYYMVFGVAGVTHLMAYYSSAARDQREIRYTYCTV